MCYSLILILNIVLNRLNTKVLNKVMRCAEIPYDLYSGMKYPPGKIEVKKLCFRAEMIGVCINC